MSGYRNRYRAREWTSGDLDKLFSTSFWPFMAGSFLFLFLFDNEVEGRGDTGFYAGSFLLAILYAALISWMMQHARPDVPFGGGKFRRLLLSLGLGAVISMMGAGYSSLLNAASGSFEPVLLQGPVVRLEKSHGGLAGVGRHVTIFVDGRNVTFSETEEKYSQLRPGAIYQTEVRLGGFGYYWRLGRNYWK